MLMLCVTIKGPTFDEAASQILSLPSEVNLLEFRLDCFQGLNESFIEQLRAVRALPVIFTLRDPRQGSEYKGTEQQRLQELARYAKLHPEYLDLESTCPKEFVQSISEMHPSVKILLSDHNYQETPQNLDHLYEKMRTTPAHLYKIAVQCNSSIDALRLLLFVKRAPKPICAMGMGEYGEVTRVLGKICGSAITYASVSDDLKAVAGQLSAKNLLETYHFPALNSTTQLYGLMGDPVRKSIGHLTHNAFFEENKIPAVYVKMEVKNDQLEEFIPLSKALGFKGMSVTMPLKEDLLNYVGSIDSYTETIGAANTLVYKEDGIHAHNTDGAGALNAIEKHVLVDGKKVVIVGAGGAAKAIIVEALRRGALVTIVNRTIERAEELAEEFSIRARPLSEMNKIAEGEYDILINCTSHEMPFDPVVLIPGKVVMDIKTIPVMTELLIHAKEKGCKLVFGYEMFIEQALEQYGYWFPESYSRTQAKQFLEQYVKRLILLNPQNSGYPA